jgi:soluble lytic murein transglycosylase-like protein
MIRSLALASMSLAVVFPCSATDRAALNALIAQHAQANGVPEALVHRVIKRESGYNPGASSRGNLGLMQIKLATARGVGYTGSAAGLLDPNTNLTYAVTYLANAYRVAGGNADRAVSLYSSGYYYAAKRQGLVAQLRKANSVPTTTASASTTHSFPALTLPRIQVVDPSPAP